MAGVLGSFSFATVAEKQLRQRKQCKTHCFLVVSLEKVVFTEGNCQGNRPSLTLCSSDSTPKLKTNMVKPRKRRFHFIESDLDTEWTIPWTVKPDFDFFCGLKMWRYHCILSFRSYTVVLTERTIWINNFSLDARALLNYDKPSRIFTCILLTRHHVIFLVQFGINKHLSIFSKTTNCTRPTGS